VASESHATTDIQSARQSWWRAPVGPKTTGVRVTLRLAVSQLVLASSHLRITNRVSLATETLRSLSFCNISSDEGRGLSLQVSHKEHVNGNSSFCSISKSSFSPGFAKQIMPILRILCYNSSLVTWTVVSLTTAKLKPPIFSMSSFAFSYNVNMFIFMILCDFCLLPAQFCYIIVRTHTEGWKMSANRGPVSALENLQWWGEPCFASTANLKGKFPLQIPGRDKQKSLLI
jgi:hypothetical protein